MTATTTAATDEQRKRNLDADRIAPRPSADGERCLQRLQRLVGGDVVVGRSGHASLRALGLM